MHRIFLREVVIDAPPETFEDTRTFWAEALAAAPHQVDRHAEFTALPGAAAMVWIGLQKVGAGGRPRLHLDIETDDVPAEVARLTKLGAEKVRDGRTWVTMRDPSGIVFDVVPNDSPWFEEHSREVS